ncbi:MAG: hypothetical protein ACK4L8_12030 [Nitrincola lacisaponensis]|uniref:hypothetical protein n=1 Tax=Nitrincola lacisaponensis TaxID=267850 RepID=UPI0039190A67
MCEILLCNRRTNSDFLSGICGIDSSFIHGRGCSEPTALSAYTPYVHGEGLSGRNSYIISALSRPSVARELTHLSLSFGEDNTLALAEMTKTLQDYNVGLIGASTSVYANRIGGFAGAVREYQDALLFYRDEIKRKSPFKAMAKQKALRAFQNLQIQFRHELSAVSSVNRSRRDTPLTSVTRATNIARSSRNVARLNVTSQIQANNLVRFADHTKFLGNGLAVIDFTSRVGNIHNEYKSGGEWERELFIESSSFAASALAGTAVVNAGVAALGILVVATPIGWVGLVVGGIAVAGTAATASIAMNNYVKDNSGGLYDDIMRRVLPW